MLAVSLYGLVALWANWPTWPGDPSRIRAFDGWPAADLHAMAWFLAWTPHALIHGLNPFFTNALNYPSGVNLAQNTLSPLLGLMTAPLTLLVSPVASVNLLLWLSYTLSASSMFLVLRRFARRDLAAFVGGALYGFSPYLVAQSLGHVNLAFVPLPPVILLSVYELFRPGQERPGRWGTILGLLVAAQVFIAAEVAATTVIVAAVSILVLAAAKPREIVPAIRRSSRGATIAGLIIAAAVAYPLWVMSSGPYRYHGPAYSWGVNADLVGTVLPTPMQRIAPSGLRAEGGRLVLGDIVENGSYLGLPLLALMALFIVICWNRRWIRFAGVMVILTIVLSLGAHLTVDGHVTGVPLPFDVLLHLPMVDNIMAARFALYTAMFSSLLVTVGLDEVAVRWSVRRSGRSSSSRAGPLAVLARGPARTWAAAALVLVSVVSLVPAWPFPTAAAEVPAYFSGNEVKRVPTGSVALISPYPTPLAPQPQLWQAVAGDRFALIGGYALVKTPLGTSSTFPAPLQPGDVQRFLSFAGSYPNRPVPRPDARLACLTRIFLRNYHVGTVLVVGPPSGPPSQEAYSLFLQAIGRPSMSDGTVTAWYGIQRDLHAGGGRPQAISASAILPSRSRLRCSV